MFLHMRSQRPCSQIILKDAEIVKLKENNNQNNKEIKTLQEKIAKQKMKLIGNFNYMKLNT